MFKKLVMLCVVAALVPAAVLAQTGRSTSSSSAKSAPIAHAFGPRVGFSSSPDQIVFGGQLDLGEMAPDLMFSPSVELGFGDNATVFAINGDFKYHFDVQGSPWRPYVGGGLGVNFIEIDLPFPFSDISETEVGANLILGAIVPTRTGSRFFTEARFGMGDIPDFKLMVGWNFRM